MHDKEQQSQSFGARIRAKIRQKSTPHMSLTDGLVHAMWGIIRNVDGYNHLDFLRDDFMISQFFVLTDLLTEENARTEEERKRRERKAGKK